MFPGGVHGTSGVIDARRVSQGANARRASDACGARGVRAAQRKRRCGITRHVRSVRIKVSELVLGVG